MMITKFLSIVFPLVCVAILFSSCRKDPVKIEREQEIEILPGVMRLSKNQTAPEKLTARLKNSPAVPINVNWTSANPLIATIDNSGKVAAHSVGETEIKATLIGGKGTGVMKVIVYDVSDYKFRIVLKNKGPVNYSLSRPTDFLSARTVERRNRYSIPIDSADIPISPQYLTQIENTGAKIVAKSKWVNTVSVHCSDSAVLEKIKTLPFVQSAALVWTAAKDTSAYFKTFVNYATPTPKRSVQDAAYYGSAWTNISINKGQFLHDAGFKGAGMEIAVIDVGFVNIPQNAGLNTINIKGAKSFIYERSDPYAEGNHGVSVTSCMAANKPNLMVGTAPEASYWLFMTEDETSEYPIEEDYWVAALEYADSTGVFIANTSLGYKEFDAGVSNYTFEDLDGKTTHAAKGAAMAAQKGMLLVVSAGNDRSFVGTPADSPDVLTVGAIQSNLAISTFSSYGFTKYGYVKPDVVALGTGAAVMNINGQPANANGTSFASPILCGMAACLWQANAKLSNKEIINVIKQSSNFHTSPGTPFGYGIPDMEKAMQLAATLSATK